MRFGGLRGRTLLAVFGVSAVALLLAAVLIALPMRAQLLRAIERNLVAETRMAAALRQERHTDGSVAALDQEADGIGAFRAARVTFIAPDGRVVGDPAEDLAALQRLDNHGTRPEVVEARRTGMGIGRRFSATLGTDLLYVALAVRHAHVGVVRLARLEAGQEPVEASRTDRETLFTEVVTELEGALDAKGQRVVTEIDPEAATVHVDTAKLHDALRNLVENAIAYAPGSTTITLASQRVGGECRDHGRRRRPGQSRGGSVAHLRALLPRRQGPVPRVGRHRPRAVHRQAPGQPSRR